MKIHAFMKKLAICSLIILAAALIFSGTAFAEGEPPAAEPQAAPPAAEEKVIVEPAAPPAVEPIAEAPAGAVSEELPAAAETPAIEEAAPAAELAGRSGEPIAPAAQDNTEPLAVGDPWWMVGLQKYAVVFNADPCPSGTSLGTSCWKNDYPIQAALAQIESMGVLPTDRKLYVEAGNYTDFVYIDGSGSILSQMTGLIGVDGSAATEIDNNIQLYDLSNGFTLSGLTVLHTIDFYDCVGTVKVQDMDIYGDGGLRLNNHSGNVELIDVNIHDISESDTGAYINNSSSTGYVKVTNSSFTFNQDYYLPYPQKALFIRTAGAVTIDGVYASHNEGSGIYVDGFSSLSIKNTIANYNEHPFDSDYLAGFGICAETDKAAPVILENVQANYNAKSGIYIRTKGNVFAKDIEAQFNTVRFGSFYYIDYGDGYIEDVQKVSEFLSDDVEYDEWRFEGTSGENVNIILENWGENAFDPLVKLYDSSYSLLAENDNGYDGWWNAQIITNLPADGTYYIRVYRAGDFISSSYELSLNYDENATTHNYFDMGGSGLEYADWEGSGTFRLENGFFNQNAQDGLKVQNRNTVYVSSITSTDNGGYGVNIDKTGGDWDCTSGNCEFLGYSAAGTATITSPVATGIFTANTISGNDRYGIYIVSKGNILVSNTDAMNNRYGGAQLDNCLRDWWHDTDTCLGAGTVTVNVTITNWYNGFAENEGEGLVVESTGNVVLADTWFNGNDWKGLEVTTLGAITLDSVNASNNGGFGAYLNNIASILPKTVTITDSSFDENNGTGLEVITEGAIALKGANASRNRSVYWHNIDLEPATYFDQLYVGDSEEFFDFEGLTGDNLSLTLQSADFDVYLELLDGNRDIIAADDNSYGDNNAYLYFTLPEDGWYLVRVSVAGGGDGGGGYELSINDDSQLNAIYPGSGAVLDNSGGTAGITMLPTAANPFMNFDENANLGVRIISKGLISISGAGASRNFRSGLYSDNPGAAAGVVVQDRSAKPQTYFDDNGETGLFVRTRGVITLFGVSASRNGERGADLDNCLYDKGLDGCLGTGFISVSTLGGQSAYFDENTINGISAISKGAITLTNISASRNGVDGVVLQNRYSGSIGNITVGTSGGVTNSFNDNGWNYEYMMGGYNGLSIYSFGNINVYNLYANGNLNGGDGAVLINDKAPIARTISVTSAVFNDNEAPGLYVRTKGSITLKNVEASGNLGTGAMLRNQFDGFAGNVTVGFLTGGQNIFNNNNGLGLEIYTNGAVVLGNITAENNYMTQGWLNDWRGYDYDEDGMISVQEFYNDSQGPDRWDFYGEAGMPYSIRMNISSNPDWDPFGFDPYLELYDEGDNFIASSDDDGGGLNSLINFTPSSSGWYHLMASGLGVEEDGFYELSLNDAAFEDLVMIFNDGVYVHSGKTITVAGSQPSFINDNSLAGLYLEAPGNITVNWVQANDNGTEGMVLDNTSGLGNILVASSAGSRINGMDNNGWYGLSVNTTGTAAITNVWAWGNGMSGVQVGRGSAPVGKSVTLNNIYTGENGMNGVEVHAVGLIAANKVNSSFNKWDGVFLDNTFGSASITVNGESNFKNNQGYGMNVVSNGAVTISKVYAEGNGESGLDVQSNSSTITLNNITVKYSGQNGIFLQGSANMTLNYVNSTGNGFGSNGDGLHVIVYSPLVLTLRYSTYMGNEGSGIDFDNTTLALPIMTSVNYFGNDTNGSFDPNLFVH